MEKYYLIPEDKLIVLEKLFNTTLTPKKSIFNSIKYEISTNPFIVIQTSEEHDIIITFSKDIPFNKISSNIIKSKDLIILSVESNCSYYFIYVEFIMDLKNIVIS